MPNFVKFLVWKPTAIASGCDGSEPRWVEQWLANTPVRAALELGGVLEVLGESLRMRAKKKYTGKANSSGQQEFLNKMYWKIPSLISSTVLRDPFLPRCCFEKGLVLMGHTTIEAVSVYQGAQ